VPGVDRIVVEPNTRTYAESRLREQELREIHDTKVDRNSNNYRGNRQNPLAESKRAEYEGHVKRFGGGCP
jgi:hypothetical protein